MLERVMQLQEERDIVRNIKRNVDEKLDNLKKSKDPTNYLAIEAFEKITGIKIPYKIMPRRDGDVAECWSDSTKANDKLEWKANRELYDMIRDAWNWQSKNPHGYDNT